MPGDGLQLRARGYTENCASTVLLALDSLKAIGQTYNVADEKTYSLKDFLKLVIRGLGVEVEVVPIDHPIAFNLARDYSTPPYHLMFDIAKTIYELGYRDLVPTPEGVKRSAQWLADNPTITDTEVAKGFGNFYSHNIKDRLIETYQRSMNKINKTLTPPLPH